MIREAIKQLSEPKLFFAWPPRIMTCGAWGALAFAELERGSYLFKRLRQMEECGEEAAGPILGWTFLQLHTEATFNTNGTLSCGLYQLCSESVVRDTSLHSLMQHVIL